MMSNLMMRRKCGMHTYLDTYILSNAYGIVVALFTFPSASSCLSWTIIANQRACDRSCCIDCDWSTCLTVIKGQMLVFVTFLRSRPSRVHALRDKDCAI